MATKVAMPRRLGAATLVAVMLLHCSMLHAADLAFPGAEGFGANATGGLGGTLYHVTNLNDTGPGSLRDAVSQPNRIVVFDLAGYVWLHSVLPVSSNITISGDSAPGQGVGTYGAEVSLSRSKNVIVRYMRFRQGTVTPGEDRKSAINILGGSDMIFDHVSIAWGRWDCIDVNESDRITFQYCMIGPGVRPQQFGCLCQSDHMTFTHNLWIDNKSRNPKAKGTVQYVNNVVYDFGSGGGYVEGHSGADHYADMVGNYFIAGPSHGRNPIAQGKLTDKIFSRGNFIDLNADGKLNGHPASDDELGSVTVQKTPYFPLTGLTIDPADVTFDKVVAGAGCSLHRDEVDQRLIDEVKSLGLKGKLIANETDGGGIRQVAGGTP
jgi:hypothetical protein